MPSLKVVALNSFLQTGSSEAGIGVAYMWHASHVGGDGVDMMLMVR